MLAALLLRAGEAVSADDGTARTARTAGTASPAPATVPTRRPRQLPAAVADFTGRTAALAVLAAPAI